MKVTILLTATVVALVVACIIVLGAADLISNVEAQQRAYIEAITKEVK